uniref:CSON012811 protein n=1 Tax=Culicoides sonorensis TaxID=179676 RepID=A0A336M6M7_CULSO
MSHGRDLDFIIFGASGFTGKFTVLEAVTILSDFRWGIAGRDLDKLKHVLSDVSVKVDKDLSKIPIIIADVEDMASLRRMTSDCKVLINCVGPFHLYGEPVVHACIDTSTHQIDICGDPGYILNLMLKYNDEAREKGSFIVPACGVDSIPGDIGVIYLESQFDGTVAEVEEYLEASERPKKGASIHYGSYASIVHACSSKKKTDQLRKKLFPETNSELKCRGLLHKSKVTGTWCTPFFGVDKDLVRMSQKYFNVKSNKFPIQNQAYAATASIFESIGLISFQAITRCSLGRKLLLSHPEFFSWGHVSHKNLKDDVIEAGNFTVHLYGKGWTQKTFNEPSNSNSNLGKGKCDKEIYVKVKGKNNGYRSTAVAALSSAKMLITDVDNLPKETGVLTPAIVFSKTRLIEELLMNGWTFEVVKIL